MLFSKFAPCFQNQKIVPYGFGSAVLQISDQLRKDTPISSFLLNWSEICKVWLLHFSTGWRNKWSAVPIKMFWPKQHVEAKTSRAISCKLRVDWGLQNSFTSLVTTGPKGGFASFEAWAIVFSRQTPFISTSGVTSKAVNNKVNHLIGRSQDWFHHS